MSRNLANRNSQAASDYARKKRDQMERARAIREQRSQNQNSTSRKKSMGSRGEMVMSHPMRGGDAFSFQNKENTIENNAFISQGQVIAPTSRHRQAASQSHVENDRYMEEFHQALAELEGRAQPQDQKPRSAGSDWSGRSGSQPRSRTPLSGRRQRPGQGMQLVTHQPMSRKSHAMVHQQNAAARGSLSALKGSAGNCGLDEMFMLREDLAGQWDQGPLDPQGILFDACDRPLLCLSLWGDEGVVGSSDHALYAFSLETGQKTRQLYSKRHGHVEWVSCCKHTVDGKVLSGGMDGKICLWPKGSTMCYDLGCHDGSVSQIEVDLGRKAVSCGYDKAIKVWDLQTRREVVSLEKHNSPVICFCFGNGTLVSGARDGLALVWDLADGSCTARLKAHQGHVTSTCYLQTYGGLFATGGQDGYFRVWDTRQKRGVAKLGLHRNSFGAGAVGGIQETMTGHVLTFGADNTIKVLDPRQSFEEVLSFEEHQDFIYSMHTAGQYIFSGAGNGMLLVHSITQGRLLYGLGGSEQGAVRAVQTSLTKLAVAGDDGNVLTFSYL